MLESAGLPVLTLDFDDEKIKKLQEIADKFKSALSIGPAGLPYPTVPNSTTPDDGGKGGKKTAGETDFGKFLKNLDKKAQGTLKTFNLINKTLSTTTATLNRLFTTTVSWGTKIAAISGGGLFGYGYISQRVTQQYTGAQGLDMTYGQKQAAENIYGARISGTRNIMQTLAGAQNNPGDPNYSGLMSIGINPNAGVAENMPRLLEKVSSLLQQYKDSGVSQAVLQARGLGGLVDVATANQILKNSDRIPQLNQQFSEQSGHLDSLLNPGALQSYQDLSAQFSYNASRIGNAFLNALGRLNKPIGDISDRLTGSIEKFLKDGNGDALFETLAQGLESLGKWLSGPDFQKNLSDFEKGIKSIADSIRDTIHWFNKLTGKADESDTPTAEATGKESNSQALGQLFLGSYDSPESLLKAVGHTAGVLFDNSVWSPMQKRAVGNAEKNHDETVGFFKSVGDFLKAPPPMADPNDRHAKNVLRSRELDARYRARHPKGGISASGAELPRGIRNNNPGNIKFARQYGAVLEDGPDASHAKFPTMAAGIGALDRQIQLYIKRGKNTIDSIFNIYSRKNKESYKDHMSKVMGIGRNDTISFDNKDQILKMIKGIISMENGHTAVSSISDNDILNAMTTNRNRQSNNRSTPHRPIQLEISQKPGSDILAQVVGQSVPRS